MQHCLEHVGSKHPDVELENITRSTLQFKSVRPNATPCVAYAPVDLDGQVVGVGVEVFVEIYELVILVLHLTVCVFAEYGRDLRHPLRA